MSQYKEYRTRTHNTAKQLKNMKTSTIRLAEAKSKGFNSVSSFERYLKELDLKSRLLTRSDFLIYMTNSTCESCFDSGINGLFPSDAERVFRALNLEHGEFSPCEGETHFYPLTKDEEKYISDESIFDCGLFHFNASSTAILNGKKHFAVEYIDYADEMEPGSSAETLKAMNSFIKNPLLNVAEQFEGKLDWTPSSEYSDESTEFITELYIPFDKIIPQASDYRDIVSIIQEAIVREILKAGYENQEWVVSQ